MKKSVITLMFLLTIYGLSANPISLDEARQAAQNYWKIENGYYPEFEDAEFEFNNMYLFRLVNNDNDGFIIIAADDRSLPVLGYSVGNQFATKYIPSHVASWIKDYERQIDFLVKNNIEPSAEVRKAWSELRGEICTPQQSSQATAVSPLLETEWSQSPYYNDLCPTKSGSKCPTGCTATATAQVMKYWQHPTTGVGSHSYSWGSGRTLSADFGNTTYDWANMPTSLDYTSTSTEVNAVATLIYHVGVGCEMAYDSNGSGADVLSNGDDSWSCAENAIMKYFRYSGSTHGLKYEDCTDSEWKAKLKNEIDNSRPVIYAGFDTESGHCFVLDGYNSSNKFHVNWGWGGWYDGYYAIGQLNPGSGGTGSSSSGTYNIDNQALFGVQPATSTSPTTTTITATVNNPSYGSVNGAGSFSNSTTDASYLRADANEGYRFVNWSDGSIYNERSVIRNGETLSLTANFEPVTGDTLYYCQSGNVTALNSSETTNPYWGIRLPASSLTAGKILYKVQLYTYYTGTYTLHVYSGGTTAPVQEEYQENFTVNDDGWNTLQLSNPYPIDETKPLWVVFSFSGSRYTYPMTIAQYSGNPDSFWASEDGGNTWNSLVNSSHYYYSWNIRALTRDISDNSFVVATNASPATYGNTTPSKTIAFSGDEVTMTALANPAYRFSSWTDNVTDNPRTVTVTQNQSYTARFTDLGVDTMTYCPTSDFLSAIGISSSDNDLYWAVKFEPEAMTKNRKLTKIRYFDAVNSSVILRVYVGGTVKPLTPKFQTELQCTESMQWKECAISPAVNIVNDKPLWIVFAAPANTYPAAYTTYSGNNNGCYVSTNGSSWGSLTESDIYGSFMIKAITEGSATALGETECQPQRISSVNGKIIVEIANESEHISIYDAAGRCVADNVQNASVQCYDIHAPGVYMVRSSSGTATKVVIR